MSFVEYLTPEWKNRRLEILRRDKHTCRKCGSRNMKMLQVHHIYYEYGCSTHDYPDKALITLCDKCHKNWHSQHKTIKIRINTHPSVIDYNINVFFNWLKEGIHVYTNKEISRIKRQQRKDKSRQKQRKRDFQKKKALEIASILHQGCSMEEYRELISQTRIGLIFFIKHGKNEKKYAIAFKIKQSKNQLKAGSIHVYIIKKTGDKIQVFKDYEKIFHLRFVKFIQPEKDSFCRVLRHINAYNDNNRIQVKYIFIKKKSELSNINLNMIPTTDAFFKNQWINITPEKFKILSE